MKEKKVLITGGAGFIGRSLIREMLKKRDGDFTFHITATDVVSFPNGSFPSIKSLNFINADVRAMELLDVFKKVKPEIVIHLASIVTPGRTSNMEFEYSVDVLGTKNVLECAVKTNVKKIIVTSSGAAYGYHPDNPEWITEETPLRGNNEFAYSRHKRIVEDMLSSYREEYPKLGQLIFRPGTVLGEGVSNQITAFLEKKIIPGVLGGDSRFVFIWDRDVSKAIIYGIEKNKTGIFNLAGDGSISLPEMAKKMNKIYFPVPAFVMKALFGILKPLGLSRYGPEQVNFIRYRPVLSNEKLKKKFGYIPKYTSTEVFINYLKNNWDE